jgi:two-component system sensor histidine kinase SenX3
VAVAAAVVSAAVVVAGRHAARRRVEPPPADDAPTRASGAELERDRLVEVVRASLDAVVLVDAQGAAVLRNPAAERYHDARHSDALAEAALRELLDRALGGERGERELELFGPPRTVLRIRAETLRAGGKLLGAVAFIRDVSDARRTESVRRDFVANVSHELKTPIGALALLAETMGAGGDPAVMPRLAERVRREADRLGHIVDDLLDLSLIEAQEAPAREPVPATVLVAEAAERIRPQADAAGARLRVSDTAGDLIVSCDRRQVVGAITNLLDNAVKYSEPGGVIECRVGVEGDDVAVAVRDHGVGIPARDLERVFERFYRVDRARSRATGGTGLGLAIVRHVAHAHGGEVRVESREGEGSTFTLTLPLDDTAPAAGPPGPRGLDRIPEVS